MNSPGDPSVSYLCPQCQAVLNASAADAGQRRQCPHCGKVIKVPGSRSSGTHPPSAASRTGGIANIPVVCPLCGTRMHATKDQIGQRIVCPDCLESVVVPNLAPPPSPPRPPVPQAGRSDARSAPAADKAPPAASDDDEYRLSEAVELPAHRSVSRQMADLLDEVAADEPRPPAPPPPAPPAQALPPQFTIKCPVCDTLLQATADEIGSTKICPDCFSSMEVKPPPPKPRRVNPVVVSDYAHDDYTLSEPAELSIYRPSAEDANPRTIGEEALRNARLAQAERERGTPELPLHPLIKGVFGFLPHAPTITRVASTGCLAGFCLWLFLTEIRLMQGTASQWFFAVGGAVALLFGLLITVSYGASSLLTVLQESAEGSAAVESWPENSLAEWITESFALLMAVFFASLPGVLFTIAWNAVGLPWAAAWIVTGVTFYALFPIVQLSILETATLTNPISTPVLQSLRDQFLLWATFYLITFFLLLAVSIPLTAVRGTHPLPVFLALGLYLSLASFIYFRLLGRLAWACQMRPIEKKKNVASTGPKVGEKDR